MKHLTFGALAACTFLAAGAAGAAVVTLDFEGLKEFESINGFYAGGTGSLGSKGPNLGVRFSANSQALIDSDAGGTGTFQNEPSPSTIMFFERGSPVISVDAGFTGSLSFFYASVDVPINIQVFDGPDATGSIISQISSPATDVCRNDPRGEICFWRPFTLRFNGIAKSVKLIGDPRRAGFDDIRFNTVDPATVPEPATPLLAGLALLAAGAASRLRGTAKGLSRRDPAPGPARTH